MIRIERISGNAFRVTIDKGVTTSHEIHVSEDTHFRLTENKVEPEKLVELSVEFLLEHESNTSIQKNFDLETINMYFPEYENEIKKRVQEA